MSGFYDLSEDERVSLTRAAIEQGRTLIERWRSLAAPEAVGWNARSAKAAEFLAGCRSVADLGCGTMQLEPYLGQVRYQPVDVVRRDTRTLVVDFNAQPLPALTVDGYAILGLLEYLFDPPSLLAGLSGVAVVSYNCIDLCDDNRLAHAWVNAYSTAELEKVFTETGWAIVASDVVDGQRLWKLQK